MAVKPVNDLFNDLQNSTKWDAGVAFHRTNALPIDQYSIFSKLTCSDLSGADDGSLEWYVKNNPVAYAGQIVTVATSGASSTYVITDANGGSFVPIGPSWQTLQPAQ